MRDTIEYISRRVRRRDVRARPIDTSSARRRRSNHLLTLLRTARSSHKRQSRITHNKPSRNSKEATTYYESARLPPPRMPESAACLPNAFRQKVLRNYHDHAQVTEPHDTDTDLQCGDERKGPSGGVKVPFPTKLHLMLSKVEGSGSRHTVSW